VRLGAAVTAGSVLKAVVAALGLAVLAGETSTALGAEETVRALSASRVQGFFFEIGERRALFLGAIQGVLYVETGASALDGAVLVCPASFALDRFQPAFTAEGHCTFAKGEADKVYARWTCAGGQPGGCVGRLTLEGGAGRFAGISGESDLMFRMSVAEFKAPASPPAVSGTVIQETASVLLVLPALRYRLP
jgi:hypothetical protein